MVRNELGGPTIARGVRNPATPPNQARPFRFLLLSYEGNKLSSTIDVPEILLERVRTTDLVVVVPGWKHPLPSDGATSQWNKLALISRFTEAAAYEAPLWTNVYLPGNKTT